jgi:hypothetical protein
MCIVETNQMTVWRGKNLIHWWLKRRKYPDQVDCVISFAGGSLFLPVTGWRSRIIKSTIFEESNLVRQAVSRSCWRRSLDSRIVWMFSTADQEFRVFDSIWIILWRWIPSAKKHCWKFRFPISPTAVLALPDDRPAFLANPWSITIFMKPSRK